MKPFHTLVCCLPLFLTGACGGSDSGPDAHGHEAGAEHAHDGEEAHSHDGEEAHSHGEGEEAHAHDEAAGDHAHDEVPLGTSQVGDLTVTFAQGHGAVAAGHEGHLVVKLPYTDGGETIVRGWIGTDDRTASLVGKAEYAASHDDYDLHAVAPSPLPEGVRWWVELQKPDGTRVVGSVAPILE